jgi:hypothetical protein
MKRCCFIFIILLGFANIYAQDTFDALKSEWKNKKFSNDQIVRLLTYRKNNPDKRSAELDYMIATSYCALNDPKGCETWFPKVLQYSTLNYQTRNLVKRVLNENCPIAETSDFDITSGFSQLNRTASVSGRTKEYSSKGLDPSIVSRPIRQTRILSDAEIDQRKFKNNEVIDKARILTLYPRSTSFLPDEDFIVVNYGQRSPSMSMDVAVQLEKALNFFSRNYKLSKPEYLITVHIVPPERTREIAGSIYQIQLPVGTIGYSWINDLSIFGVISNSSSATGTLKHELFHIIVKNEFPDIPVWLEEGLASLYEESHFVNDSLTGVPGWRGKVLKEEWSYRPTVKEILCMYPDEFDGFVKPDNISAEHFETINDVRQAAIYAMARYLMLYLQNESKKLNEIYFACRNIDWDSVSSSPGDEYVRIFETVLQKNIQQTDKDFTKWFGTLK